MNTELMKRPLVYDYTDFRKFLQDLLEYERKIGRFSYSVFAERAGFKARSYLRTVITGKRNLSADGISKIIVGFKLSLPEGEAFRALVNFNQARDFEERHWYWETFLQCRPKKNKSLRVFDEYLYLARMAYPILLVALRQKNVDKSLPELSRLTGLTGAEVREALKTLEQLGAIKKTDDQIEVTAQAFTTSNDIPNVAIQSFHGNMLDKAKASLNLSPQKREFQSRMVALTRDEFLYLRTRVRELMEEVEDRFGGKRAQCEKVFALNVNLIPVSEDFIRTAEKDASQKSEEDTAKQEKSV